MAQSRVGKIYKGDILVYGTVPYVFPVPANALVYHNLSNPSCYTSGSTTMVDLSGNGWNGTLSTVLGDGASYSANGNIIQLKNNLTSGTPSGNVSVVNISLDAIANADFSTSGITMNFWLLPAYGVTFGAFSDPLPQNLFTINEGGRVPWAFQLIAKNGGNAEMALRLGNKSDTNEQVQFVSYTIGTASTFINTYRLLSFVWDCGSSATIYYDGSPVATSSTSKTWTSSGIFNACGFGMGGQGVGEYNNSYYTTAAAWAETWSDGQVLDYFNETKGFFGR